MLGMRVTAWTQRRPSTLGHIAVARASPWGCQDCLYNERLQTQSGACSSHNGSCFQDLVLCSFFQKPSQIHLIRATVPVSLEEHLSPLPVLSHPSVCCSNGPFLALPFSYLYMYLYLTQEQQLCLIHYLKTSIFSCLGLLSILFV